jgi:ACR3 family arsenite efflux pump ArsB
MISTNPLFAYEEICKIVFGFGVRTLTKGRGQIRPLLLIVAIVASLAFRLFLPGFVYDWFNDAVYVSLFLLVFCLMIGAQFGDIVSSFKNVRFYAIAWSLNFIIIPVAAFILALIFLGQQSFLR